MKQCDRLVNGRLEGNRVPPPDEEAAISELELAARLISTIEAGAWEPSSARRRAAWVLSDLGLDNPVVLDLIIASAERYKKEQHIDDAFPYNPNGFDVLALVGHRSQTVRCYLRHVMKSEYGIPKWAAMSAFYGVDGPFSDLSDGELWQQSQLQGG